jgi:transcriptional regulator with XRE-family HTH domain
MPSSIESTVEDWEERVGESVRRARVAADMAQAELADRADVSLKTIGNLEHGRGSSMSTLIRIAVALDRTDWLESFTSLTPATDPPRATIDTVTTKAVATNTVATNPAHPRSRRWCPPSSG